ncbi:hypothetical protein DdX_18942 [Ditylenchus destructor]|uniref:Uncharacterized protein n=1 Tax=Ditylenchus destructor TaxID=166010 RepID=A0AAD4MK96_9BILA|nr:hypothetical protein DdX_18942 [Ditylenchus destructor]
MENHVEDNEASQSTLNRESGEASTDQPLPPPPAMSMSQQSLEGFTDGCEVCMAEAWWRMAAYQNTLFQHQAAQASK